MAGASRSSAGRAVRVSLIFSASSHPAQSFPSSAGFMLETTKESTMSSLHSLLDDLVAAGSLYGWRLDAVLLGGMLWVLAAACAQLRFATA
jgi:hypothetical protein